MIEVWEYSGEMFWYGESCKVDGAKISKAELVMEDGKPRTLDVFWSSTGHLHLNLTSKKGSYTGDGDGEIIIDNIYEEAGYAYPDRFICCHFTDRCGQHGLWFIKLVFGIVKLSKTNLK